MTPFIRARNVLNYRGGARRDSVISFEVDVNSDNMDEPPEVFFVTVSPVRTVIVLTPRVPVTICGSKKKFQIVFTDSDFFLQNFQCQRIDVHLIFPMKCIVIFCTQFFFKVGCVMYFAPNFLRVFSPNYFFKSV